MKIASNALIPLMREMAALTKCEQLVFLHCLDKYPRPIYRSGDIQCIALQLSIHPRTVQRALISISGQKHLAACVRPIRRNRRWIREEC